MNEAHLKIPHEHETKSSVQELLQQTKGNSSVEGPTGTHSRDLILLKNIPHDVIEFDLQGRIIDSNHSIKDITPADLVGRKLSGLFSSEHRLRLQKAVENVIKNGVPEEFELSIIKDKKVRWHFNKLVPIRAQDEYNSLLLIQTDITRQKNAEAEAKRREEILKAYTHALPDTVFVVNKQLKIETILSASERLLNHEKEFYCGKTIYNIFPREHARDVQVKLQEAFKTGISQTFEYDIEDEKRWYEARISKINKVENFGDLVIFVMRDITEMKRNEEKLRGSFSESEQLLASISSIMIGVDADDNITRWNSTAEKKFGIKAETVLGKKFLSCGINWDWSEILAIVNSCREKSEVSQITEKIQYEKISGEDGFLGITIYPVVNSKDEHGGYLLLASDITERINMETQLVQAQKLESIGELAAGIAHEINTPTQYVSYNVDFLKDAFEDIIQFYNHFNEFISSKGSDEVIEFAALVAEFEEQLEDLKMNMEEIPDAIEQTQQGVMNVSQIVKAMKSFSHPGGREKSFVNLNEALNNTITVSRNEWKYHAEIKTDFDEALPMVPCMPSELNQVFLNMIVNAAHAIKEKNDNEETSDGLIQIKTSADDDFVYVEFRDNGMGIPDDIKAKIYDPFFTTKEVGKGTGQGLAISYNVVVEKHGGRIDLESKVGEGTTFTIVLPLNE